MKDWNLAKNIKKSEMKAIVRKVQMRKELGKDTTFLLRGREVDIAKISRWMKHNAKQEAVSGSNEAPEPSKTVVRLLQNRLLLNFMSSHSIRHSRLHAMCHAIRTQISNA
jgi:hypothetical protein